jgi:hypothetical protein
MCHSSPRYRLERWPTTTMRESSAKRMSSTSNYLIYLLIFHRRSQSYFQSIRSMYSKLNTQAWATSSMAMSIGYLPYDCLDHRRPICSDVSRGSFILPFIHFLFTLLKFCVMLITSAQITHATTYPQLASTSPPTPDYVGHLPAQALGLTSLFSRIALIA